MSDARTRIREAEIHSLGYAYCDYAGLPWLWWPLQTTGMTTAEWFGWIVKAVARAPVCRRTEADCWGELRRIDHPGLARALARIAARPGGDGE
jgi:hypothetical protein